MQASLQQAFRIRSGLPAHRLQRCCYSLRPSSLARSCSVKPRIVLIGWLGAEARHFDKYVQMWKDWGHDTVAVRPPTSAILVPPRGDACAQQFARRLQQATAHNPEQPVLYHVFSNAGFLFLSTVLRLVTLRPDSVGGHHAHGQSFTSEDATVEGTACPVVKRANSATSANLGGMDAIIFDSSPAPLTPDMASRGLVASILSQQAQGIEDRHPRLVAAAALPLDWLLRYSPIASRSQQLWAAWGIALSAAEGIQSPGGPPPMVALTNAAHDLTGISSDGISHPVDHSHSTASSPAESQLLRLAAAAPMCPQLALYSAADALIPPASVEAFMTAQGIRGVQTSLHCWQDTAHCEHFRYHKEEYKEQLASFIKSLNLRPRT